MTLNTAGAVFSPIKKLDIKEINKEKIEALWRCVEPVLLEAEKKYGQSESQVTTPFRNSWSTRIAMVIGGLAGLFSIASGVVWLICRKTQQKNRSICDEEKEIAKIKPHGSSKKEDSKAIDKLSSINKEYKYEFIPPYDEEKSSQGSFGINFKKKTKPKSKQIQESYV